jgi:hypothetical protein
MFSCGFIRYQCWMRRDEFVTPLIAALLPAQEQVDSCW